jgi:N-acetylglucosaminyl-diphospho-decaprenol L-rhamnosyltransferase
VNSVSPEPVEIVVAIVNFCTPDLTIDCLASLEPEVRKHLAMRVTVADNASPDGSGGVIAKAIQDRGWTAWARLLQLPTNGGFAYGNNAVFRTYPLNEERPTYFWLLNSDTIVRPGATQALIDVLATDPAIGIVGSCLEDLDGTQQHSTFRFHSIASEFEAAARFGPLTRLLAHLAVASPPARDCARFDWVSGASMMIRRDVLRHIGLMDEQYFLYFEETDFCRVAANAGWQSWFAPDSHVIHLVGRSSGVTDRDQKARPRSAYWFQSRRRYFVNHHGRSYALAADAALACGTIIRRAISMARGRPSETPHRFLRDLYAHSALWQVTRTSRDQT